MLRKFSVFALVALMLMSGIVVLGAATQEARAETDVIVYDTEYSTSLSVGPAAVTWLTLHDSSTATYVESGQDHLLVRSYNQGNNYKMISRSVVYFTMPVLTGYESLASVNMKVYVDSVTNTDGWHLRLYQPTNFLLLAQPIVAADYDIDNVNLPISDSIIPSLGWNTFTLNAQGLSYLYARSGSDCPMYLICEEDKGDVAPPQISRGMLVQYDGYTGTNPLYLEIDGFLTANTVTKTWDGGGVNNLASTAANWNGDALPQANNRIVFDGTSTKACTWDLTTVVYSFNISTGYSGTITQGSDMNVGNGGYRQVAGTFTGSSSYLMTVSGTFNQTGGTISDSVLKLKMTGNSVTASVSTNFNFYSLEVTGSAILTHTSAGINTIRSTVAANAQVTIPSGKTFTVSMYVAGGSYSNSGMFIGDGTLNLPMPGGTTTLTFGTICVNVRVYLVPNSNGILALGASTVLGKNLLVDSNSAVNTMTLSHGSNYQLTVNGAVTLGTRGIMTQGTGTWSFHGLFTMNGASSVFTQGGNVHTHGLVMSAGTLTGSASYAFDVVGNAAISGSPTITTDVLNLNLNGYITAWSTTNYLRQLSLQSAGAQIDTGLTVYTRSLYVDSLCTFHIDGVLIVQKQTGVTEPLPIFNNTGHINGDGEVQIILVDEDATVSIGYVHQDVELKIFTASTATKNNVLTVDSLHSYDSVLVYSAHGTYTMEMLLTCEDAYASVINITARGIVNSSAVIHGEVDIAGGTYMEYITDGTVHFYSGVWTVGWELNQVFSGFVHVYPDWSSPAVTQELGIRTIIDMIMILIPAMVLGLFMGGFGAVIGALLMIAVLYFGGSTGLNVLIPGFLAGLLYFVRGR